jgi:DNA helicase-2/ATP-dependent DNA helicase PcrA
MTYSAGSNVDQEQTAAVEAEEPAIAVLAGPGSGKTRTLSHRARFLLSRNLADSALLLTFTNKAAAEMKSRAVDVAAVPSKRLQASTFHTFCSEVLRSHGELVGISKDFEIIEPSDVRQMIQALPQVSAYRGFERRWSSARLRRLDVPADLAAAGEAYERHKRDENVVDFDDMVVYVAAILQNNASVAEAFGGRFPHILVDEFQDTNAVQVAIVHALAAHARTTSIFADDDQAIFGFAGAEAENIRRFVDKMGARVYPLTTNYRSGRAVVDVANALIVASASSSGRRMNASRSGGSVQLRVFASQEDEAGAIVTEIASAISGGLPASEIAVLARAGRRADTVLQRLHERGIPVSDWRGETHTPEGRRLLAACLAAVRGALNARQAQALCSLMEVPASGACPTGAFLAAHADRPLAQGLERMRDLAFEGARPHAIAKAAQEAVSAQRPAFGQVLQDMVESVAHFELYDPEFSLEHLLAELALGSIGRAPTQGGGVKLASLHRTKGLQWKVVYLLGLEEGHLPDSRCTLPVELAEERRLCFVGVSRAEDRLIVTRCNMTNGYAQSPSQFVREMGLVPIQ